MSSSRRSFLKTAGMAAAVTSAAPLGLRLGDDVSPSAHAAPAQRATSAAHFALELDGTVTDALAGWEGGFPFGKVAVFQDGSGGPPNKLIVDGGVEDLVIRVGPGLSDTLRQWVTEMVAGEASERSKKNGAVIFADFNYQAIGRLEFAGALITEVTFPAGDAASKEVAYLTVAISAESSEFVSASGPINVPVAKQKKWLASNFRVTVEDLPTQRVSKVEAFSVKQTIVEFTEGGDRIPQKQPGKIEYPNLALTFSMTDSAPWFDHFRQSVLLGVGSEKEGMVEYLGPDLFPILRVKLHNLGIFRCELVQTDADQVAMAAVELYMEGLTLPAVQ